MAEQERMGWFYPLSLYQSKEWCTGDQTDFKQL